jgi:hypothetical protein
MMARGSASAPRFSQNDLLRYFDDQETRQKDWEEEMNDIVIHHERKT